MSEAATKRTNAPRVFGRTYDHAQGILSIMVAGKTEGIEAKVAELPEATRNALALMQLGDIAVGHANKVMRDGGSQEDAEKALREALSTAAAGKLEFSEGIGLGMASAPATALVGRALVELGKKFVRWNGKQYDFEGNVEAAKAAMKTLYEDTDEVNVGTAEKPKKMTGRQFYGQLSDIPAVVEKVKSYKKAKAPVISEDALG